MGFRNQLEQEMWCVAVDDDLQHEAHAAPREPQSVAPWLCLVAHDRADDAMATLRRMARG